MPGFKIINNSSEITLNNQWVSSTKCNSRLVDAKGKAVSSDYKGRQYRIIEKRERILSTPERIGRGFLGTLVVVCTLFLGLFSKSVRNLFIKPKKNVRFGVLVPPSSNLPSQIATSVSIPSALDSQRKVDPVKVKTDQVPLPASSQKPKKSEEEQNMAIGLVSSKTEELIDGSSEEQALLEDNLDDLIPIPPSSNLPSQIATSVSIPSALDSQRKVDPKKSEEEQNISEKELQQGMSISEETVAKIQTCMKNVLHCKEEGGVKLYTSQGKHRVFALDTAPGLIFKMNASKNCHTLGRDDSMKARYQTMINAQTVVRTHQLALLVIPHAKLFTVIAENEEYDIIAEQKVDINPHESVQEQYFQDYADSLNETIRQLAVFICKTGYSDVEWRNNPILNNSLDGNGNRKIALIDIEEMDSKETGLFGGAFRRTGLVGLVNEEQGKIVEDVAKQNGVSTSSFASAHGRRKEALESNSKLKEYYATKNITKGDEPIHVDIDSLGLDINKEGIINTPTYVKVAGVFQKEKKIVTLKTVIEDLVKEMNKLIQSKDHQETAKGKRYFALSIHNEPFDEYDKLGLTEGKIWITEEDEKQKWLPLIIQSLIEKGHIFKLDKVNGYGYFIQA